MQAVEGGLHYVVAKLAYEDVVYENWTILDLSVLEAIGQVLEWSHYEMYQYVDQMVLQGVELGAPNHFETIFQKFATIAIQTHLRNISSDSRN